MIYIIPSYFVYKNTEEIKVDNQSLSAGFKTLN